MESRHSTGGGLRPQASLNPSLRGAGPVAHPRHLIRELLPRLNNSVACRATADDDDDDEARNDESKEIERQRQELMKMMQTSTMTGSELRQLIVAKWNREYDCRLTKRGNRMYFQVFWKFLGQKSFPLTDEEYQLQLDAVAEYLTMWGVTEIVRSGIGAAKWSPGHTIGGGARAYSIPLGVDVGKGGRSNEWNSF